MEKFIYVLAKNQWRMIIYSFALEDIATGCSISCFSKENAKAFDAEVVSIYLYSRTTILILVEFVVCNSSDFRRICSDRLLKR